MAKSSSKSQLIRQALLENPGKGPSEVAEILKSKGVVVSNAYVSVVKSTMKKKGRKLNRAARGAQAAPKSQAAPGTVEAAADFVSSVGSFEEARAALEKLQKISQMLGGR